MPTMPRQRCIRDDAERADGSTVGWTAVVQPLADRDVSCLRILVAEDDDDTRDLVATALVRGGVTVLQARDGVAAVELAAVAEPDLVILDVVMPRLDGWAACRRMREHPGLARVPVVMLTSLSTHDDELQSVACGADAFLAKPASARQLMAVVNRLL